MAEEQAVAAEEKLEQKVTVKDAGPARKLLTIEIPESRIQAKIEESYDHLRDDAVLPGFRRGRAPRRLLEKRFSTSVRGDVKGQIISESYSQAIEDEKLSVIGEPEVADIEELELPESGPLVVKIDIEVAPEVSLPPFDKIELTKSVTTITDADVEQEIERVRERLGRMAAVEGAKAQAGDFIKADVRILAGKSAKDDAEQIAHHPETYIYLPGKDREDKGHIAGIIVDDLGKQFSGKTAGDEQRISTTGPAGHEDEKIKDQPITIVAKVNQVERLEPAPLERVIEQAGVSSADDLKSRLRQSLEQRAGRDQRADLHEQICNHLLEKVKLELPEGLTGRQTQRVLRRRQLELMYRGLPQHEVEQQIAEMRSGSEEEARRQLKLFFIIDQAAKDLDVDVSENEINGQIAMMAMQQGQRPEKLRQQMLRGGELEQLYLQIREQKTLDKVVEQATVKQVEAKAEKPKASAAQKTTKKKTTKKKVAKKTKKKAT